jgi:hypothetical protein
MSKNIREVDRSILCAALVAAMAVGLSAGVAHAGVIAGPATLTIADGGYQYSGLGFTATVNSTLTAFTFWNQGLADTVDLVTPSGTVLDSVATPSGNSPYTATVSWSLTAGASYYLLQSTVSNGLYAGWNQAAPSDAEIALTDTGDFSSISPASANFSFGGGGGSGTEYWADFTNITTSPAGGSTPEPASFTLVLPFAVAILLRARRKGFVR